MKFLELIEGDCGPAWHAKAACNEGLSRDLWPEGHDPDKWYPTTPSGGAVGERPSRETVTAHAKSLCAGCEVRPACLADAIDRGEKWGVWGGVDFETEAPKEADDAA